MSRRSRALAGALFVALHLAFFAPLANNESSSLEDRYRPIAEGVLDGAEPYTDFDYEYPPLSLPLLLGPAAVTDDAASFVEVFSWEMIVVDLAIVLLLAFGVGREPRAVWAALGVYTVGLALMHVRVYGDVGVGGLALHRLDLLPAALVLAAALARRADRSGTWSAMLATGATVKAFPAALFPAFAHGERRPVRVVVGALVPLAAAAALVLALGDQFWSAITYHTDRDLQIETVGASLVLIADALGGTAHPVTGGGSWNLEGGVPDLLRLATIAALVGCYLLVVRQVWVRRIEPLEASVLVLAPVIILAPVLSPQFLIWLLPVSAAAYGLRAPNLVLIPACLLSGLVLSQYSGVFDLEPEFVIPLLTRNALLLVYLTLILAPLVRRTPAPMPRPAIAG